MSSENFSGEDWVVVQGSGATVTKTASTVTASGIDRDADSYVYKDYTAAYFGATFKHQFEIKQTGVTASGMYAYWQLGNEVSSYDEPDAANAETDDFVFLHAIATNLTLNIYEDGAVVDTTANFALSLNVGYFVTIQRVNNDWTLTIRTGSHAGAVQLQETITGTELNTFRYLYVLNSYNTALADKDMAGYTKELNINKGGEDATVQGNWFRRRH